MFTFSPFVRLDEDNLYSDLKFGYVGENNSEQIFEGKFDLLPQSILRVLTRRLIFTKRCRYFYHQCLNFKF